MYFAQSGKLEHLLDWFHSSPPALFESSSYRTHPLLLCLLVPGGPKSKRLLEDVIANRESLNLRLGPDVALFIFGHSKVECAVPAYSPFDFQHGPDHTVDASGGLGVWKSFP